jgi:YidC/Oxa1 family membrane protein insertase
MGFLMRLAYSITNSYLLSILLFTLVMEIILIPFQVKQQKNQIQQAKLAPKANAIRKKYAGRNDQATQQKMNNEIMEMYQEEKYNPASGCGTLLIQFPIIICLYNVVVNPLRYICNVPKAEIAALKEFLVSAGHVFDGRNEQINIINIIRDNVSDYFAVAPSLENAVLPDFTAGPFDLSKTPTLTFQPFDWLMLIPILTFVVMVASQKIMQKFTYQSPEAQAQQNSMSMKIMTWSMPLLSVYIEFSMSAAIGVYWVFRSVISTIERIIISKVMPLPRYTEEEIKEIERQIGLSNKQKKKEEKKARSLHYIDADEEIDPSLLYSEDDDKETKKSEDVTFDEENTVLNGEVIDNKNAPAPIKNDEKSSYKNKKQ